MKVTRSYTWNQESCTKCYTEFIFRSEVDLSGIFLYKKGIINGNEIILSPKKKCSNLDLLFFFVVSLFPKIILVPWKIGLGTSGFYPKPRTKWKPRPTKFPSLSDSM